jgi:mono/diheme cytochrome c family protein
MVAVPLVSAAMWCFAQQHTPWVTPKTAQDIKNPLAGNKSVLADAKTLYTTNCAPCHGTKGKGDGPAAAALSPKPADHSSAVVQNESDGSLFWKLSEGRNPMPSYKKILSDNQRWELVNYIRTLARTPVAK